MEKLYAYEPPQVEVIKVEVEQGFAASNGYEGEDGGFIYGLFE